MTGLGFPDVLPPARRRDPDDATRLGGLVTNDGASIKHGAVQQSRAAELWKASSMIDTPANALEVQPQRVKACGPAVLARERSFWHDDASAPRAVDERRSSGMRQRWDSRSVSEQDANDKRRTI